MNTARAAAVGLRLEDGRVMVIGGADENFNFLASAEIYDPSTNTWSLTAPMNDAHFEDFTAVLLPGRKVLVAGGAGSDGFPENSAEIYDEATNTWTLTGSMNVGRVEFATVVLNNGQVLAIGGATGEDFVVTATAEIYNPVTNVWTLTGSMNTARGDHAAVRLLDGRVLVTGGDVSEEDPRLTSAEIFDPHTGQWTPTGDMTTGRSEIEFASGVLLPDGRVLVPGGHTAHETPVSSAEVYDPRDGYLGGRRLHECRSHRSLLHRAAWQSRRAGDGRDEPGSRGYGQCRYCRSDSLTEPTYFTSSRHAAARGGFLFLESTEPGCDHSLFPLASVVSAGAFPRFISLIFR